jgi:hypothetical protein
MNEVVSYLRNIEVSDLGYSADKLMDYANIVAKYLNMKKKGEIDPDLNANKKLMIKLKQEYKDWLTVIAKNNGTSVSKYTERLVLMDIANNIPQVRDKIMNDIIM